MRRETSNKGLPDQEFSIHSSASNAKLTATWPITLTRTANRVLDHRSLMTDIRRVFSRRLSMKFGLIFLIPLNPADFATPAFSFPVHLSGSTDSIKASQRQSRIQSV
ncbi:hypothetical protein TNCV_3319141 [Trichonephila clavipes]|nr:hypothetical protein TNCV_3319141 [Trichonephila clavipes]